MGKQKESPKATALSVESTTVRQTLETPENKLLLLSSTISPREPDRGGPLKPSTFFFVKNTAFSRFEQKSHRSGFIFRFDLSRSECGFIFSFIVCSADCTYCGIYGTERREADQQAWV